MNEKVIPFELVVLAVGSWESQDLWVTGDEQHRAPWTGLRQTWLSYVFSAARCPLSPTLVASQPGALVNFHTEEAFETRASFMLWEELRGVNPV